MGVTDMGDTPTEPGPEEKTGWVVRTDAGARKIIERLDTMRVEIAKVEASSVRWDRLIIILGSAATVIVGGAWNVSNTNSERIAKALNEQMQVMRAEIADLREMKPYVLGNYQVAVEKKPPAKVAEEVRSQLDGGQ